MKTFNRIELIGFVMNNPEIKLHENGSKSVSLTLKTIEYYKETSNKQFHQLVFWNGLCERIEEILFKGDILFVVGKLKYRKTQAKLENGETKTFYQSEIIVDEWTNLSSSPFNENEN